MIWTFDPSHIDGSSDSLVGRFRQEGILLLDSLQEAPWHTRSKSEHTDTILGGCQSYTVRVPQRRGIIRPDYYTYNGFGDLIP